MHGHDPEKKVIDFDRLRQMRREQGRARKRTVRRVIAGAAAALLLIASAPAAHTEGSEHSA